MLHWDAMYLQNLECVLAKKTLGLRKQSTASVGGRTCGPRTEKAWDP